MEGGRGEGEGEGGWTFFMGGVGPLSHHVKILVWQLEGG